jgi:hypothetical protein
VLRLKKCLFGGLRELVGVACKVGKSDAVDNGVNLSIVLC